ncbi:MAG: GGDEF domain-containing protein [Acholeplasmatales bacterium]|nr:MAG: GGDEF domain-containing protein [Acholeplasmatales bacterium]
MDVLTWIVFITIGFMSLVPLVRLYQYRRYRKYRMLRYFVTSIFAWTVGIFFIHLSENLAVVSAVSLMLLPLIFLLICLGHETIQQFIGHQTPRIFKRLALGFFAVNLILSATNEHHLLVRSVPSHTLTDKAAILFAPFGPFFFIHTALSYLIIAAIVFKLLRHLWTKQNHDMMHLPFALIMLIMLFGLGLNVLHVFVYTFYIDISYLFIVIFGYYIYWLVFTRDFQLRLMSTGREFLVHAMREMYVIMDSEGGIVEYSPRLFQSLDLPEDGYHDIETLMYHLHQKAVIFNDFEQVKKHALQDKLYLHRTDEPFTLPKFKQKGTLILFFDETQTVKLLDQLNYAVKHDMMTGLLNRSAFETDWDALNQDFPHCGVLMTDLNGLKRFNDTFGHRHGDQLIEAYAEMLKAYRKPGTAIYRFGGDEFLLFFEQADEKTLQDVEASLHAQADLTTFPLRISVSTGTALRGEDESLDSLLQRADLRLYAMKSMTSARFKDEFDTWRIANITHTDE